MAILQCFQPLRGVSCVLSDVYHAPPGAEGSPAQFPYLLRVLDNDPADGALQGRKEPSEITAAQPPTPFWQRNVIMDIGCECLGIHWPQSPGDVLNPLNPWAFPPQRNWSTCSMARHNPSMHFMS